MSVRRAAFTLVEILIVVVILAVLTAAIIPRFADSATDAKSSTLRFNLQTLRRQIDAYKTQHADKLPGATLVELTQATDIDGTAGSGAAYRFGPYLRMLPENPFTNSSTVTAITASPATDSDVTGAGGWLYNATTGEVWADHEDYVGE